jgi:hypothetical protein
MGIMPLETGASGAIAGSLRGLSLLLNVWRLVLVGIEGVSVP